MAKISDAEGMARQIFDETCRTSVRAARWTRSVARHTVAVALTTALVTLLLAPTLVQPPAATAFGTIRELGQRAEHEIITRIALGCPAGTPSDGSCFEPESLDQLAGKDRTFGAVGAPDSDTQILDPEAHCDDADYLNVPGYPQDRATATSVLQECIDHLREEFREAIDDADDLLDGDGTIEAHEVGLSPGCVFTGGIPGRAKCEVLEGFGRALHGAQDFYSHSNWADEADPAQPIGINNPPGLNRHELSPILAFRGTEPVAPPADLSTGFFKSPVPGEDACPGSDGRVTHACLNKDKMLIEPGEGIIIYGDVFVRGLGSVSDPQTPRGNIKDNALKAVGSAILESRRQWDEFRAELVAVHGPERAANIILALTKDFPGSGAGSGSAAPPPPPVPEKPTIPGGPTAPGAPPIPGVPGIPGPPIP